MGNRRKKDRAEQKRLAGALLRRVAISVSKLGAVAAVAAALFWGASSLHRFATTSPSLAIETITISGHDHATEVEIKRLLGIAEGDNILRADTAAAQAQLLEHPWIESATVERSFPQGLEIVVLEREAVALVDLGHLYLVARTGEVFKRAMPGDPMDLPVLTGLSRDEWSERPGEAREKIDELLGAIDTYAQSEVSRRAPISELHFDETGGLTFYLGDQGLAVKLGQGDLAGKLVRLDRVLAFAEGRGERLELVRLDNRTRPGWVTARLAEGDGRLQASLRGAAKGSAKGG